MKVCSITVTYNRKNMLRKNILKILEQTIYLNKIYIIDNASSDGTYEYIEDLISNNKNIEYIRLDKNLGGSEGFYQGIMHACNDGMEYLWGMDDDAFPEKDALEELVNVYKKMNKECCLWSNCNNDNFSDEYKEVNNWMFVGFFMPISIVNIVGMPRNDFFIYHDDSEYSYRIIKNGYKIYKVKNSKIEHGDMEDRPMYSKTILNKQVTFPKMPDWKLYYYSRNRILKYPFNDFNKYKAIIIQSPKEMIKLSFMDRNQAKVFIKGYWHGIMGIKGKVVSP